MYYTTNAIAYTFFLAGPNGAAYTLYPYKDATEEEVRKAEQEIRNNFDAVSIRLATEEDRDNLYVEAIFREPAVNKLKWYEINTDNELIRTERKKGTSPLQYVETYVLPLVAQTRLANARIYHEVRAEMEDEFGFDQPNEDREMFSGWEEEKTDLVTDIDVLQTMLNCFEKVIIKAITTQLIRIGRPVSVDELTNDLFSFSDNRESAVIAIDENKLPVIHQAGYPTITLAKAITDNAIHNRNLIRLFELLEKTPPVNFEI